MGDSDVELDEYSFPEIEPDVWKQIREKEDLYNGTRGNEAVIEEAKSENWLLEGPPQVLDGATTHEDENAAGTIRIELEEEESSDEAESIWDAFSEIADADWQGLYIPPSPHESPPSIPYPPIYFLFDRFPYQQEPGDIEDLSMSGRTLSEAGNLLKKYKRSGSLSVTNIAAPLWCQQKIFYDLAGLQKLGAAKRPTEFKVERKVMVNNKPVIKEVVIKPDKAVYERREQDTTRGQTIHQRLERQVVPERIVIPSKSKEERFALKIIEMLTGLHALSTSRLWREMPVFGFLEGIPVNGIIDELQLVPSSKGNSLRLSDTKTKAPKAKIFDVSDGHRLQLMLYKHLLDGLLSPKFDWDRIFKFYGLNSESIFSDHFLAQMLMLTESNQLGELVSSCRNLQNLTMAWMDGVQALDIHRNVSDPKLAVVFRSLVGAKARPKSSRGTPSPEPVDGESEILSVEEFVYDAKEMKGAVRTAMDFWLGVRPISGVSAKEAWKCNSCEYKNDCEWRQEQAVVLSDQASRG